MPREQHIVRQVQWKNKLQEYGCSVNLEKRIYINKAPVIIDVYAEVEEKKFLIELGDIQDKRKIALLELYSRQKHNTIFIHEEYGENRIQQVLESINGYLHSPEYKQILRDRVIRQEIQDRKTIEDMHNKRLQLLGLSIIMWVPAIVLAFLSPEIAAYWIGFWVVLIFVLPVMLVFMLERGPISYLFSLLQSLESQKEAELRLKEADLRLKEE